MGIGYWGLAPIPNPQSPSLKKSKKKKKIKKKLKIKKLKNQFIQKKKKNK